MANNRLLFNREWLCDTVYNERGLALSMAYKDALREDRKADFQAELCEVVKGMRRERRAWVEVFISYTMPSIEGDHQALLDRKALLSMKPLPVAPKARRRRR